MTAPATFPWQSFVEYVSIDEKGDARFGVSSIIAACANCSCTLFPRAQQVLSTPILLRYVLGSIAVHRRSANSDLYDVKAMPTLCKSLGDATAAGIQWDAFFEYIDRWRSENSARRLLDMEALAGHGGAAEVVEALAGHGGAAEVVEALAAMVPAPQRVVPCVSHHRSLFTNRIRLRGSAPGPLDSLVRSASAS